MPLGGLRPSRRDENRASSRGRPGPLGPAPTLPVEAPAGAFSATASTRRGFLIRSDNARWRMAAGGGSTHRAFRLPADVCEGIYSNWSARPRRESGTEMHGNAAMLTGVILNADTAGRTLAGCRPSADE